ncbi:phage scaffolding protein [uncultured Planococcus sp.]|uniref:phage scaffolding protein n=1 Tax=uncultured Planococcus sp. TaxID=337815 RepID=UPI002614FE1B|nr:phage scaffolding protein [uncultured Planococcus sp.]
MNNDLLRLNLQFFADEQAEQTQEPTPDGQSPDEPKLDASESQPQTQAAEKLLTQAEFDDALKKRLERERKKFEGYDELKTKAAEYEKQLEEKRLAELGEQERSQEIAKKYEEENQSLQQRIAEMESKTKQQAITNEFIKVATGHNVAYIDDALKLADLSGVSVGEDGLVEGVDDIIKALVEQKPFLVAKAAPKPVGQPSNGESERTDKTKEQLLADAADKFKRTGKNEDMAAYSQLKRELGM